ncbi:hypothetical protein, partial [Pandoraea sp. B-6]
MRNTVMQEGIEMIEPIDAGKVSEAGVAPPGGKRALAAGWLCAAAVVLVAGCAAPAPSASLTRFDLGPPTIPAASANVAANAGDTTANTA